MKSRRKWTKKKAKKKKRERWGGLFRFFFPPAGLSGISWIRIKKTSTCRFASASFVGQQYFSLRFRLLYAFHGILCARHLTSHTYNSLTFHWLWQLLRFSLTFYKILWLFPDLEKLLFSLIIPWPWQPCLYKVKPHNFGDKNYRNCLTG